MRRYFHHTYDKRTKQTLEASILAHQRDRIHFFCDIGVIETDFPEFKELSPFGRSSISDTDKLFLVAFREEARSFDHASGDISFNTDFPTRVYMTPKDPIIMSWLHSMRYPQSDVTRANLVSFASTLKIFDKVCNFLAQITIDYILAVRDNSAIYLTRTVVERPDIDAHGMAIRLSYGVPDDVPIQFIKPRVPSYNLVRARSAFAPYVKNNIIHVCKGDGDHVFSQKLGDKNYVSVMPTIRYVESAFGNIIVISQAVISPVVKYYYGESVFCFIQHGQAWQPIPNTHPTIQTLGEAALALEALREN